MIENTIPRTMNSGNRLYNDFAELLTLSIALPEELLAKVPRPVGSIAPITIATSASPTTRTSKPETSLDEIPLLSLWNMLIHEYVFPFIRLINIYHVLTVMCYKHVIFKYYFASHAQVRVKAFLVLSILFVFIIGGVITTIFDPIDRMIGYPIGMPLMFGIIMLMVKYCMKEKVSKAL